jgi:hypothetical protein
VVKLQNCIAAEVVKVVEVVRVVKVVEVVRVLTDFEAISKSNTSDFTTGIKTVKFC